MDHITDHDLERYYLGMITDEAELVPIEEHLLWCHACIDRAEHSDRYVDRVRATATEHFWDEVEPIRAKRSI